VLPKSDQTRSLKPFFETIRVSCTLGDFNRVGNGSEMWLEINLRAMIKQTDLLFRCGVVELDPSGMANANAEREKRDRRSLIFHYKLRIYVGVEGGSEEARVG
jgi:hypothetical protein